MALKDPEKEHYIQEMSVWIEQEENRLLSCSLTIRNYEDMIASLKKGVSLERRQAKLIKRRLLKTKKDFALYLERNK